MANTEDPRVTAEMTLEEILEEGVLLLQKHHDPRGSEVTDAMTIDRAGAVLFNFYEDWLIALQTRAEAGGGDEMKDTRFTGATTTVSIPAGEDRDFEIVFPTDRVQVWWLRVRSNSGESGPGGRVQLFVDSLRVKPIYDRELQMGDPLVDVDDFIDRQSWGAFADDGSGLELDESDIPHMYGTITNGGSGPSTFTIRVVAQCT